MKILKNISMAAAAVLAFCAVSCAEDDLYTKADPVSADCQQAYFPGGATASYEVLTTDASIDIPVARIRRDGAARIPVVVESETPEAFTPPQTVDFSDGETETLLRIGLNVSAGSYTFTVQLTGDENVDPYKVTYATVSLLVSNPPVELPDELVYEEWAAVNQSELYGRDIPVTVKHILDTDIYIFSGLFGTDNEPGFTVVAGSDGSFYFQDSDYVEIYEDLDESGGGVDLYGYDGSDLGWIYTSIEGEWYSSLYPQDKVFYICFYDYDSDDFYYETIDWSEAETKIYEEYTGVNHSEFLGDDIFITIKHERDTDRYVFLSLFGTDNEPGFTIVAGEDGTFAFEESEYVEVYEDLDEYGGGADLFGYDGSDLGWIYTSIEGEWYSLFYPQDKVFYICFYDYDSEDSYYETVEW